MSAYLPLTQPAFKRSQTSIASFAVDWEIFVRPRGGTEGEQVTLYAEGKDGSSTLTQPLATGPGGHIGAGDTFAWIKGEDLPVDLWARPQGTETEWQVIPEGDAAVIAGGIAGEDLSNAKADIAVIKEGPLNVEYPEYGADGTQAKDSSAAFKKAVEALPVEGGVIFAPRKYKLSEKLNLDEKRAVRITGQAGLGSGKTSISQLLFTQSGSEALISARSTHGFGMSDLQLEYTSGSYTGPCIDLSHGTSGEDSAAFALNRFQLLGAAVHTALGIDLDKVASGSIRDFQISGMDVGIRGMKEKTGYSNVVKFDSGIFTSIATIPMKNAGVVWDVDDVTFAKLISGKAGAYTSDLEFFSRGLSFRSCYMGDANTEGTWITFRGYGLGVMGGMIGSGALGVYVPDTTSDGIGIGGGLNFWSMTDAVRCNFGAGTQHYRIGGDVAYTGVSGKKVSLDNGATDSGAGFLSH